jgi:hypothetical protein
MAQARSGGDWKRKKDIEDKMEGQALAYRAKRGKEGRKKEEKEAKKVAPIFPVPLERSGNNKWGELGKMGTGWKEEEIN